MKYTKIKINRKTNNFINQKYKLKREKVYFYYKIKSFNFNLPKYNIKRTDISVLIYYFNLKLLWYYLGYK